MIRLIVCDDHDMVRTALMRVLELHSSNQVIAEAASGEQLLQWLKVSPAIEFDVLLLDLNLGSATLTSGLDLIKQLIVIKPTAHIVVVSMHDEPDIVSKAIQNGAMGYVSKASSIDTLQEAICHAHQGHHFLDPILVESIVAKRPLACPWDAELTKREREVMVMLCGGQRVSDIASSLCLSIKTVSTHKIRLMEKLGIKNNADLIRLGLQNRLI